MQRPIVFNKAQRGGALSWPEVSKHKVQEINSAPYNHPSQPGVLTKVSDPYGVPLHPPIVPALRHVHTTEEQALRPPGWETTWDCCGSQSGGKRSGSSTSQRERRRGAQRLPGGEAGDPPSAKYAEVGGVSIGQELDLTDTGRGGRVQSCCLFAGRFYNVELGM